MANNRMALVCKRCRKGVAIAKFYPKGVFIAGDESGWGFFGMNKELVEKFFVLHSHDFDNSSFGKCQYELRYEIEDDDDLKKWSYETFDNNEIK